MSGNGDVVEYSTTSPTRRADAMRRAAVHVVALATCFAMSAAISASDSEPVPEQARNVELVGHLDIEGGGMVDVHEGIAYVGFTNANQALFYLLGGCPALDTGALQCAGRYQPPDVFPFGDDGLAYEIASQLANLLGAMRPTTRFPRSSRSSSSSTPETPSRAAR